MQWGLWAHSDHDGVWKSLPWPGARDRGTHRHGHPATGSWHITVHVDTWDSACDTFHNTFKKVFIVIIKIRDFFYSSALIAAAFKASFIYWISNSQQLSWEILNWSDFFHTVYSFDLTFLFLLLCTLWCHWPLLLLHEGREHDNDHRWEVRSAPSGAMEIPQNTKWLCTICTTNDLT